MNDKYISRDNLELAIEGLKVGMTPNWNENDKSSVGYIENKPFYTEYGTIVDNYSGSGIRPKCNFIVGNTYDVIWNGVKYKGLKCRLVDDYKCIGGDGYPFYIDDDGGDNFYVEPENGFTVSIFGDVVRQLDEKYIPDSIARGEDVDNLHKEMSVELNNLTTDITNLETSLRSSISSNSTNINTNKKNITALETQVDENEAKMMVWNDLSFTLPRNNWYDITYGNGKFVALSDMDKNNDEYYYRIACSEDNGMTWKTVMDTPANFAYLGSSIAYGDGRFVISATNSSKYYIIYSDDGITWTTLNNVVPFYGAIIYGGGKFVIISNIDNKIAYSNNGITWTIINDAMPLQTRLITYGNGKFVALEKINGTNKAAYSEDGIIWTLTTMPSYNGWSSLTYGNGKFVAINDKDGAAYSEDGITWTLAAMPSVQLWYNLVYGDGKFIAYSFDSNQAAYSEDGINWTSAITNHISRLSTYGNDRFVSVPDRTDSELAYHSYDGLNWFAKYTGIRHNDVDITDNVRDLILEDIAVSDIVYTPSTAQVGQTIVVSDIDENGKPIAWEAVDARSDWNQSDENAPDYVKNRTHWANRQISEILPECTIDFSEGSEQPLPVDPPTFAVGKTYTVKWNGVEYECVGQRFNLPQEDGSTVYVGVCLGDLGGIMGGDSTGEPFVLVVLDPSMVEAMGTHSLVMAIDGSTSATISIEGMTEVVHKLDNKYLDLAWIPTDEKGTVCIEYQELSANEDGYTLNVEWVSEDIANKIYAGEIKSGDIFVVVFDGVRYECPITCDAVSESMMIFGNMNLYNPDSPNTGEPFLIVRQLTAVIYADTAIPHSIVMFYPDGDEVVATSKLPKRFIPNLSNTHEHEMYSVKGLTDILSSKADAEKQAGESVYLRTYNIGGVTKKGGVGAEIFNCSDNVALGDYSHAQGFKTNAIGKHSFAGGHNSVANGESSFAFGCGANAYGFGQSVFGVGNVLDTNGKYLHIVGNGTFSEYNIITDCSNAHTLDWEGNAWFAGDVYVGSTSGTNKDEGSVKLQKSITGTPGQFVVIGDDGNVTTKTIGVAEEASF